ncbi:DEAD/DEAH box helicase [Rathayibacter rathayi]|uniref:RNA helicase n=1 Tax=Rathayibacter rathayi TaxID=33887 RepID=A0ABD6WC40_RATRA|nr:DEAD/DEAH box helicase [Rathayibacter rathayi]AZZ47923.1 RNA helicase [Rathayibacter rathayi]MWV74817.1 DEAD/DEAH box helicase [Rathayibacter rathayi NCPPB 2980 = VKM Ac-1601]PPF15571.1 RNA helicase [Rathayibacter rathayi]PPF51288.1 RNA helicase [Rathayibacter rathayi]PPG12444.1 RNA helicase [Rathayibacter rathayi]
MPKNKKPAGGRPAKNFEPNRFGASSGKSQLGGRSRFPAAKPGSRSEGHRGFRPIDENAPKKARWNADERAARATERTERPARGYDRDERPSRSFGRDERPSRGYDRDARPARGGDRDDRPGRSYDREARPARGYDRDTRPARSHDRDERPARSNDRNERPARSFDRDARPARSHDRDERPARSYGRDERPARTNDRDVRPARGYDRSDRPARSSDRSDRPARSFDRDERPARSYDRGDRPSRSFDQDARPSRSHGRGDRPTRSYDRDSRPSRRDSGSDFYPSRDARTPHQADDVVLERLEATATLAVDVEGVTFGDLGLGGNIVRMLTELGAASPFPIQAATIPEVLAGKDVLGRGKTGSGKTIAFGAPVVERLMENNGAKGRKPGRAPRALILAPTRELAMQIDRTIQPIARSVGLFTTTIYGGVPQYKQVGALQRGVDIVIATPGRLEDLVEQGRLDLSNITITVLDEADHMCDLGFLEPVQRILRQTIDGGQRLLFSATLDKGVATLVDEFLVDPSVHEVAGEDQASSSIDHRVLLIEHRDKAEIIEQLAARDGKTLIFTRTRAFAEQLAEQLDHADIPATSLHGDLNQSRRTRNLALLTSGRVDVLVATDVAARGIHVDDIDLVIQADAPDEYKTYLHRSGRTGRAGKKGTVVTLITRNRRRRMEELLDRAEIEAEMVDARPGDRILREISAAAE